MPPKPTKLNDISSYNELLELSKPNPKNNIKGKIAELNDGYSISYNVTPTKSKYIKNLESRIANEIEKSLQNKSK